MSISKSPFSDPDGIGTVDQDHGERQLALEYLAEAWNNAEEDGLETLLELTV